MSAERPNPATRDAWDGSLATGNPQIDHGHMMLFAFVNDLSVAAFADAPCHELRDAIFDLTRLLECHVATEERLMVACGYRGADELHETHRQLSGELSATIAAYKENREPSVGTVLEVTRAWLHEHVQLLDREFVEYLDELREFAHR